MILLINMCIKVIRIINYEIIDYVLSDIRKDDEPRFRQSVNTAVDAADAFIRGYLIEDVMCKFNKKA